MSSAGRAAKISPAAAVHGMQGTINRLADIFQVAMTAPPPPPPPPHVMAPPVAPPESTMDLVTRAVNLLESDDSDILPEQQGALIKVLGAQGNEHFLKFYVTMKDKSGRRAFVERMIGEPLVQQPDKLVQDTDSEMLALN
jgi:hypothetical protein